MRVRRSLRCRAESGRRCGQRGVEQTVFRLTWMATAPARHKFQTSRAGTRLLELCFTVLDLSASGSLDVGERS